jgi:pimeloyl-ACP methyl ester carboxylesterase
MDPEIEKWKSTGNYFDYEHYKIFYFQDGSGEDLLVIPGFPFNSFEWSHVLSELSKNYRVTIIDLLGIGFSDKPDNHKYSFEEFCKIINHLLRILKIAETHVLCHDLGVNVAQELIANEELNSFTIKSCVFMNGYLFCDYYHPSLIEDILSKSPTIIGRIASKSMSKKMTLKLFNCVSGPFTKPKEKSLEQQWQILNYKKGNSIIYLFSRLIQERYKHSERWINALQTTTVPICYICGPFDKNSGVNMANLFEKTIPNSRAYLLNKYIGYRPYLEDPDNTIKIYNQFIRNALFKNLKNVI